MTLVSDLVNTRMQQLNPTLLTPRPTGKGKTNRITKKWGERGGGWHSRPEQYKMLRAMYQNNQQQNTKHIKHRLWQNVTCTDLEIERGGGNASVDILTFH